VILLLGLQLFKQRLCHNWRLALTRSSNDTMVVTHWLRPCKYPLNITAHCFSCHLLQSLWCLSFRLFSSATMRDHMMCSCLREMWDHSRAMYTTYSEVTRENISSNILMHSKILEVTEFRCVTAHDLGKEKNMITRSLTIVSQAHATTSDHRRFIHLSNVAYV